MELVPNGRHIDVDGNPVEVLCKTHDCKEQHMILPEDFFLSGMPHEEFGEVPKWLSWASNPELPGLIAGVVAVAIVTTVVLVFIWAAYTIVRWLL